MKQSAPVSVVIPAYNGERFIRAAIESVQAQTLPVSEIVVVDDGSTDRTAAIAESLGAVVICQPNAGVSAARNAGIRAAKQPWIALLDADDTWEPEKTELQWSAVERYPDGALVYCGLTPFVDSSGTSMRNSQFTPLAWPPLSECVSYYARVPEDFLACEVARCPSTVLVRRDALVAAGLFDETLKFYEDYECFLRILTHHSFVIVERPLVRRRIHDENVSHNRAESNLTFIRIIDLLNQYPEKYPAGAARALDNSTYWFPIAMSLVNEGRMRAAHFAFAKYLKKKYSNRAALLWCLTFLSPSAFKWLRTVKQSFVWRTGSKDDRASSGID
jgi:glycosyltransferase involved in cell wall biosynthesis